jgi:hypothetical protein
VAALAALSESRLLKVLYFLHYWQERQLFSLGILRHTPWQPCSSVETGFLASQKSQRMSRSFPSARHALLFFGDLPSSSCPESSILIDAMRYSTSQIRPTMSAFDGGLKRSTQHFFSDARDGVDRRWVEDMFEVSMRCGRGGVEEPLAVRIRSSTEWLGNSMNGRARLCASKPEPNEI